MMNKHHQKLNDLHNKFKKNRAVDYADETIKELDDLKSKLDEIKEQMLNDIFVYKNIRDEKSQKERFDLESKIIDKYSIILKEISKDSEDSLLTVVSNLKSVALKKKMENENQNIKSKFHNLWNQCDTAHKHIESIARKIISEIYTLREERI